MHYSDYLREQAAEYRPCADDADGSLPFDSFRAALRAPRHGGDQLLAELPLRAAARFITRRGEPALTVAPAAARRPARSGPDMAP
jgi:hypothetical protein